MSAVAFMGMNLQAQTLDFTGDKVVCINQRLQDETSEGGEATFKAVPAGMTGTLTYAWDFGDGKGTSTEGPEVAYTYTKVGTYVVKLTVNYTGGSLTVSHSIEVEGPPNVIFNFGNINDIDNPLTACQGGTPIGLSIAEQANSNLAGILWNRGMTEKNVYISEKNIGVDNAQGISALAYTANGCFVESEYVTVMIVSAPKVDVSAYPKTIHAGEVSDLAAVANVVGASYEWIPATNLSTTSDWRTEFSTENSGTYEYTVNVGYKASNGDVCSTTRKVAVTVIDADKGPRTPITANNLIVPNSAQNGFWIIEEARWYRGLSLTIYNKLGKEVYTRADVNGPGGNKVWDGRTEDGTLLPSDAYYYIIQGSDAQGEIVHTGSISILHK